MIVKEQHIIRKTLKICFGIFTLLLLILFLAAGIKNYIDHKKLQATVVENNSIINKIEGKNREDSNQTKLSIPNEILASTGMTEMEIRQLVNNMFDENGNKTEEGEQLQEIIEKTIVENNEYITYEQVQDHSEEIESLMKELAGIQQSGANLDGKIDQTEDTFSDIVDEIKKNFGESLNEKTKENSDKIASVESDITNKIESLDGNITSKLESLDGDINTRFEENNTAVDNRLTLIENNLFITNEHFQDFKTVVNERTDDIYDKLEHMSADKVFYDKDRSEDSVNAATVQEAIDTLGKSVGDGKKLLADAITAKGGTVAENPTFEQLKQAIMDIPNEITIEEAIQGTSASIVYHYHYHEGNDTDGGGCYEWQLIRTYQQPHSEGHNATCERTHDDDRYTVTCHGCGATRTTSRISEHGYTSRDAWEKFYNDFGYTHTYYTTEQEYGYVLACGKLDGQIIGAEISYQ